MSSTVDTAFAESPMREFIRAFLDSTDYAPSTKESYEYALNRVAAWLEENGLTFDDLTVARYNQFLGMHGWAKNMKRIYGASLRAFFKWMGQPNHPIFTQKLPKDDAPPGRVLDLNGIRNLFDLFDPATPIGARNLAMIALMIETGLRAREVCGLQLAKVDLRHRKFTALVKGQEWREGIFSNQVAQLLQEWLDHRASVARKETKTFFVSVGGKRPGGAMTPDGLRAIFRYFGDQSGIGAFSPHDIRRTMAALLTEAGAPSRLVQLLGRWDDIRMVERYTRSLRPIQIDRYTPLKLVDVDQLDGPSRSMAVELPLLPPRTRITPATDVERCLNSVPQLSSESRALYKKHLEQFIQWMEAHKVREWKKLTAQQLSKYLKTQGWSFTTQRTALSAIRMYLKWSCGIQHPALEVQVEEPSTAQKALTDQEIRALVAAFDDGSAKGLRDLALIVFILETGVRAVDVCGLTLEHLDLPSRKAQVLDKRLNRVSVSFSSFCAGCLQAWLKEREQLARSGVNTVFVSTGGANIGLPVTWNGLRTIFRRLSIGGETGQVSMALLRRTAGALSNTANPPTIQ